MPRFIVYKNFNIQTQGRVRNMYNYIKMLLLICTFLFSMDCFAQKRASSQIPITVSLISGTKINKSLDDLSFKNIRSKAIAIKNIKTPENGVVLEISNLKKRRVVIEINDVPLRGAGQDINESKIFFKPSLSNTFRTSENQTLSKSENQRLSIGGELNIPKNMPNGNYTGELILTLVY